MVSFDSFYIGNRHALLLQTIHFEEASLVLLDLLE